MAYERDKKQNKTKQNKKPTPSCDAVIAMLQCSIFLQQQVWQLWSVQPSQMECNHF